MNGLTPLIYAAKFRCETNIIRFLIENGSSLGEREWDTDNDVLYFAIQHK
jgi:hypothetical protein